jgi:hypothetical protein
MMRVGHIHSVNNIISAVEIVSFNSLWRSCEDSVVRSVISTSNEAAAL